MSVHVFIGFGTKSRLSQSRYTISPTLTIPKDHNPERSQSRQPQSRKGHYPENSKSRLSNIPTLKFEIMEL